MLALLSCGLRVLAVPRWPLLLFLSFPPAYTTVLTVNITALLLTCILALVERELSGKEVLFTLVIERLLRKRGTGAMETKGGRR